MSTKENCRVSRKRLLFAVTVMVCLIAFFLPAAALGAEGSPPDHSKSVVVNSDGTYTVSLNMTGESEKRETTAKTNVIVVLDLSGSMNYPCGFTPTTDNSGEQYGVNENGDYFRIYYVGGRWRTSNSILGVIYEGTRYIKTSNETRLSAAKEAVDDLASELLGKNTSAHPDVVEMALIGFSNVATLRTKTASYDTFSSTLNGLSAVGGTNWEDALMEAGEVTFGDKDPTYVIFVSDGNPTFRMTKGGTGSSGEMASHSSGGKIYYGSGSTDNNNLNYENARTKARKLVEDGCTFYTIGAYGNVDRMRTLTNYAYTENDEGTPDKTYYYAASDTAALNEALDAILTDINTVGFGSIEILDGTTGAVSTATGDVSLLHVDPGSFRYYRSGIPYSTVGLGDEWTNIPDKAKAVYNAENGEVQWDLSSQGILEDGVTYTVTFSCAPSQYTFDLIAELKNAADVQAAYDALDENIKKYLHYDAASGSFALHTNTSAKLNYTDSRNDFSGSVAYNSVDPQPAGFSEMKVKKSWVNNLDQYEEPGSVSVILTRDGSATEDIVTLNGDNNWSGSVFVAVGQMTVNAAAGTLNLFAPGHDYSMTESAEIASHWELDISVVRPMIINGVLTPLERLAAADVPAEMEGKDYLLKGSTVYYRIENNVYSVYGEGEEDGTAVLSAVNTRKSYLDFTKTVTGSDAPKNALFLYHVKIETSAQDTIRFFVRDEQDEIVTDIDTLNVSGAKPEYNQNNEPTGYFSISAADMAASENGVSLYLKAGWTVRFVDLSSGSTYFIIEAELPEGFSFTSAKINDDPNETGFTYDTTEKKISGAINAADNNYAITNTNTYGYAKAELTAKKILTGREWTENDAFTFTLTPAEGAPEPVGGGLSVTASRDHPEVSFGEILFKEAGTYTYTVAESVPEGAAGNQLNGVTYDSEGKTVTVTVTENQDGTKTASVSENGSPAVFTNTYATNTVDVALTVNKALEGRDWLENDSFSFLIEADQDNPKTKLPEATAVSVSADSSAAAFGPITFGLKDVGTYVYRMKEEIPADAVDGRWNGITYSDDVIEATVVIADDGAGNLSAEVTYKDGRTTITNRYSVDPVSISLPVKKELSIPSGLTGPASIQGAYTFTLAADGQAPLPAETELTNPDADGGIVTFGDITFSEPGTYTYTVAESGSVPGVVNDEESEKRITVTVTDQNDGTLKAETDVTANSPLIFTNTYGAEPVTVMLAAQKVLKGRDLAAGEFSFALAGEEGAPLPADTTAKNDADGEVNFTPVTYTKAGTYSYTITETAGDLGGVTYDASEVKATVTVTDNGEGALEAKVSYGEGGNTFTNTYKAEPVTATLEAAKVLEGRALKNGEFGFELKDADGEVLQTKTNTADGKVIFDALTYKSAGTYKYTIAEVIGSLGGVAYDTAEVKATVTVTDNGNGALEASVSYDESGNTFTNTYKAGTASAVIEAQKELKGRALAEGEFSFELKDSAGEALQTKTNNAEGKVTFASLTYDTAGTYEYTITETAGDLGGVTYDASEVKAAVTVTDNGEGALEAKVSYGEGGNTFTNTYKAKAVMATLEATKVLEGRALRNGEFSFDLKDADGKVLQTKTNTADGKVTFEAITYNTVGTYEYAITETAGSLGGVTYDASEVKATVTVTDNGEGSLEAKVSYGENGNTFTNTYAASPVTASLEAKKVLEGRALKDGEFSFDLKDADGKILQTKTNTADGKVTFDAITYNTVGTYEYTITETAGDLGGVTYDAFEVKATVTVTDNGEGSLEAKVSYGENGNTFTNTYAAGTAYAVIEAKKVLEGRTLKDGEFSFDLKDADGKVLQTKTNAADGKVTFDTITYETAGTYEYIITETEGSLGGVTYDSSEVKATVTVTDTGGGALEAKVSYGEGGNTFTNTYAASSVTASMEAKKVLTGRSLAEGEFGFELKDADGNVLQTKTNDAAGKIAFDAITYDTAGTYDYIISETAGNAVGVTYDTAEVKATVTVTDNGNGALTASVSYGETGNTFTNVYKAEDGVITIEVTKDIIGRDLYDGEFSFTMNLSGIDNAPLPEKTTVTNDGVGKVSFGPIHYTEPGEYVYEISEIAGDTEGVTYDDTVIKAVVTVTETDGKNVAELTFEGGNSTFTNTYTPILNTEDHFAYIIGYPDGTVRPQGDITRAEVATIFFRMLADESRAEIWSNESGYSDVAAASWFNNAVSTLTKGAILNGYGDGTFAPNKPITRAEFATMAIRFFKDESENEDAFSDVSGHWAERNVQRASAQGLINGYPDGTFKPDQRITRAEAMTIVNRVLRRCPDKDHLLPDMIQWPDNADTNAWYYAEVQEATNSHDYQMSGAGGDEAYEIWQKILPVRDWAAFEKEWSDANSAENPGNVVK
ncbi:MAG: Spy0128 family protein [Bacillota bacterium]|jgi:pilin isopeptide linkage protein